MDKNYTPGQLVTPSVMSMIERVGWLLKSRSSITPGSSSWNLQGEFQDGTFQVVAYIEDEYRGVAKEALRRLGFTVEVERRAVARAADHHCRIGVTPAICSKTEWRASPFCHFVS
jgi:hypothetical protein